MSIKVLLDTDIDSDIDDAVCVFMWGLFTPCSILMKREDLD